MMQLSEPEEPPMEARRRSSGVTTGASASASASARCARPVGAMNCQSPAWTAKPVSVRRAIRAPRSAQAIVRAAITSRAVDGER